MAVHKAPLVWADALLNMRYKGLSDLETKELNTWLLDHNLSFVDCIRVGAGFIHTFNGAARLCAVYTFKEVA